MQSASFWQAAGQELEPLQTSGVQLGLPGDPGASAVQVPGIAVHVSHAPPQAVSQHTLSAQLPEMHWLAAVQDWPLTFLQVPDESQELVPLQVSGSGLLYTGLHEPLVLAHERHVSSHSVVQQYPSLHVSPVAQVRQPDWRQSPSLQRTPATPLG
jgi:hypothetical protein